MVKVDKSSLDRVWKVLLIIVLLIYGITKASGILIPIVFAAFLSIILNPVVKFFENRGLNEVLSIVITLLLVTSIVGFGIYYVSFQAKNLILDLPDLVDKFNRLIDKIVNQLASLNGYSSAEQIDMIKKNSDKLLSSGANIATGALSVTSSFLSFIVLMPIYVFFMLLYRQNFKNFLLRLDKNKNRELLTMATEVKSMVHNYIAGLSIVITIIAVLNTIGLVSIGLKYAVFMGVVSAVLTIIPYIGIFIGGLLPFIVALLTKDSLIYPLLVVAIMGFVQFLEGNFITPKIIGSKVNVNPLAAIIALVIGAQIWGIVGMMLAIPLTGITKIIFSHYERLKPYAFLLQSESEEIENPTLKDLSLKKKIKTMVSDEDEDKKKTS